MLFKLVGHAGLPREAVLQHECRVAMRGQEGCRFSATASDAEVSEATPGGNDDGNTVRAMDVLFPGIGEIVGGSQREERYEVLKEKMLAMEIDPEELYWYLDLRKFGSCVHSGFGLGFERLVQFVTGMGNIRDVIPYPRTPGNAHF